MNIAVDGKAFAQLKSPQFTCIVVPAGAHIVTAGFGGLAGPQSQTASTRSTRRAGRRRRGRASASQMGLVQGAMASRSSPDAAASPRPDGLRADADDRTDAGRALAEI